MSAPLAWSLALVMAGGAAGGLLRYLVGQAVTRRLGHGLPWGTLAVNLSGAFGIGLLAGLLPALSDGVRLAALVGLLGSYTTVSALALEVLALARRGRPGRALAWLLLTVVAGLAAAGLGLGLATLARAPS